MNLNGFIQAKFCSILLCVFALSTCCFAEVPESAETLVDTPESTDLYVVKSHAEILDFEDSLVSQIQHQRNKTDDLAQPGNLEFGYDQGFFFNSPAGIKSNEGQVPFSLKINSRLQFRHTYFDSQTADPDENDFEFERLRIVFSGHAYTPDLTYFTQIDGDSDQSESADFLDYFIRYDIGHDQLDMEKERLGFLIGKWKLPFNRSRAESGFALQFTDRAIASTFFDINRSLGFSMYGALPLLNDSVNWEFALFNGFRTGGFRPVRQNQLDTNFGVSGRMFADLYGEWGKDGEPDLNPHEFPSIRVGAGFAATRVDAEGQREFTRQRAVDTGEIFSHLLPASVKAYNVQMYAADANFKYQGLSILSEYYFRHMNAFTNGAVPDTFDHGFLLQGGYFLIPKKLELLSRWSRIVGNSGTLGLGDQSADEVAIGGTWYIKGHNLKLTFDATHLNGAPLQDLALNILPGDDGMLYRTQLQFQF